jgi:hypothetical protein
MSRKIILHYHLFKNAGTSVDHSLKANFRGHWHAQEGKASGWPSAEVTDYLLAHTEIKVLSSHTALLPVPVIGDTNIYPVIFIRNPIDRVRSIYDFERKQTDVTEGSKMAKITDLCGFVEWRLQRKGDRSLRNFQTHRFAAAVPAAQTTQRLSEEERALLAIDALPFIGIVEQYDRSLARLQDWLSPVFKGVELQPTKANVTQRSDQSLDERLAALRAELGPTLYKALVDANQSDLNLYSAVIAQSTRREATAMLDN